jgi:prefoldin beta subunit
MSQKEYTPQQQQELIRLQQLQQQVEMVIQQRVSLDAQVKETETAIKELEEAGEVATCYKNVGGIMIKSLQPKLLQESKERKEMLDMRLKSLMNQEERMKKQFEDQRQKIQQMLK